MGRSRECLKSWPDAGKPFLLGDGELAARALQAAHRLRVRGAHHDGDLTTDGLDAPQQPDPLRRHLSVDGVPVRIAWHVARHVLCDGLHAHRAVLPRTASRDQDLQATRTHASSALRFRTATRSRLRRLAF